LSDGAASRGRSFADLYGRPPELAAEAPGRVNLIGEHTDYNGGYVLPLAIPQRTRAELARSDSNDGDTAGRRVRAWSAQKPHDTPAEYLLGEERPGRGWLDYVQGVTQALAGEGLTLGGFDLRIESSVPAGGGLSSSSALEVALLRALRGAFALDLDDVRLALVGKKAENGFVGAPVGIMDQMAASLAGTGEALFLDTRSLRYERVPLPAAAELAVVDSCIPHSHAAGEYRVRRAECERAAALLGVAQLRDAGPADLPRIAELPPPLDRRARHVVTEDERVLAAVAAMRAGDLPRLGGILDAGHRSLRDDFEVSTPEVDLLVSLARAQPGVFGARMTGGGFGGAIVILAERGRAAEAAERAARAYHEKTGRAGRVLVPAGA